MEIESFYTKEICCDCLLHKICKQIQLNKVEDDEDINGFICEDCSKKQKEK